MALTREFDKDSGTVQLMSKGWPITPKMKMDDPAALLHGLSQALETAYIRLRDGGLE